MSAEVEALDLDAEFGACREADLIHPSERKFSQKSMIVLNEKAMERLKYYFLRVESDIYFSHGLLTDFIIIWLVDKQGNLILAVEELELDGELIPLPPKLRPSSSRDKLGHPALVNCEAARIGGELSCKIIDGSISWEISNKSGRYGTVEGRTLEHLENVRDRLEPLGINMIIRFLEPANDLD